MFSFSIKPVNTILVFLMTTTFSCGLFSDAAAAEATPIFAGVAKVDVTDRKAKPVNDPLYVKALALKSGDTTAVIITVDAVAIGEIGGIKNNYLPKVRAALKKEIGIEPKNLIVNANHCHGTVCADIDTKTIEAVKAAVKGLVPVTVGSGTGFENRIMENRRLKLKSGKEIDVRHAYALPPDDKIVEVGPVDPQIGILKLNRKDDGRTLAVVYNFACHPIQGVPSKGNTADFTGFSSAVIEDNLSDGTIALFIQGCGGDINPARYKDVDHPRDAETLGNLLGLSTLKAVRKVSCKASDTFSVQNETLTLPRGDRSEKIFSLEKRQQRLLNSLKGTSLNFKTFVPLHVKYNLSKEYPSYYSHRYLYDKKQGRRDLKNLDAENRKNMKRYIENIHIMEELTRLQANLRLLKKHQASMFASGKKTIDVEVVTLQVGDFVLVTFPGELTVRIGLNIKKKSPHKNTFVAGYTNGYIYYAPTADQLRNVGGAQEDSDCILAPEWQGIYEKHVAKRLSNIPQ